MSSEQLSSLVRDVRQKSFHEALHTTIAWKDTRPLRARFQGEDSYDYRLPEIFGESVSFFIEQRAQEISNRPLLVFDGGCGELAAAIQQGYELFGQSVHWVGMNATIYKGYTSQERVYIDSSAVNATEEIALHTGKDPITLISGDLQRAPELLSGLNADVVLMNKTVQYLGDPWGALAQAPGYMNESAVLVADEVPVDSVIPELKDRQKLERFLNYCAHTLRLYFTHTAQEISVFHRSAFFWDYKRGMQIPLKYTGETKNLTFIWTIDPDKIGPGINPYVTIQTLTYAVAWNVIEAAGC